MLLLMSSASADYRSSLDTVVQDFPGPQTCSRPRCREDAVDGSWSEAHPMENDLRGGGGRQACCATLLLSSSGILPYKYIEVLGKSISSGNYLVRQDLVDELIVQYSEPISTYLSFPSQPTRDSRGPTGCLGPDPPLGPGPRKSSNITLHTHFQPSVYLVE